MKVNEMIKLLSDFNPMADVKINIDGIENDITLYGWCSSDSSNIVSTKDQKLSTSSLSFFAYKSLDNTASYEQ